MVFKSTVAAAAALFTLIDAAPTPSADGKQSGSVSAFSVSQVPVPQSGVKNGARAYAKALRKFQIQVPHHVQAAAQQAAANAQSGSDPATPQANDEAYLSPVQVGSPAQTLMLDFDTGSSDLWVFSDLLPANEQTGHSVYQVNPSKLENGETWEIQYGDGSGASGTVYGDSVAIGGVTATTQAVEAATSVSSTFTGDTDTDGLVGLGFSSINTVEPTQQTTFFDTVKSTLAQPLFAAYLRKGTAGAYDFGAVNPDHYSGDIGYTDVDPSNGFWEFSADTVAIGGTSVGTLGDTIADTGTSIILAPSALVREYYSQVSGAQNSRTYGGYVFPCSATLPDLSITIGGAARTVPGSFLNYAAASRSVCFGGLQTNQGLPFTILGDTFLKSQYVVFNGASTPQIGFATQA